MSFACNDVSKVERRLSNFYERPGKCFLDQVEGSFVFAAWNDFRRAAASPRLEHSRFSPPGALRLVFLPGLLFRLLRDREVRGFHLSLFWVVEFSDLPLEERLSGC